MSFVVTETNSAPQTRARLRRRVITGGIALVAAFTASAIYDSWRLKDQIMSAANRELGNLANALGEEAGRKIEAVDVLLRDTAHWYEMADPHLPADAIEAGLASRVVGASQVSLLSLVDASGLQRYRSRATARPLANVADRPYFAAQRANRDTGLFINPPIVTRSEGVPALVISRRLEKPDGSFNGVVSAVVTLQQLQSTYAAMRLGEGSALVLTMGDGALVVRVPAVPGLPADFMFPELVPIKDTGVIHRAESPMDGRAKLVSATGIRAQPLILAITRDVDVALKPWYDQMRSAAIRTGLWALLVALTIAALLRQLRRLDVGEQALRQSEGRYAMAMEAANEGHAEWNIVGDSVFASDKWRLLHGIDKGQALINIADVVAAIELHPDDRERMRQAIEDHLAGRTPALELDYRVHRAGGSWCWIEARGRCQRDGQGAPLRLFCAATDISVRKEADAARAVLEARLQQTRRLEALGTLAGGIAHDFNNILGAILGFGEMAQQRVDEGSTVHRHLGRVLQAGTRARLLVKRILDFSRSVQVEPTAVDMRSVVDEAVDMLTPSLPASVSLEARLDAGPVAVWGDATQLYQVVTNLCTNAVHAVRATQEGGAVQLVMSREHVIQQRSFLHGQIETGEYLRLDVIDSGIGIALDVLPRVFDPFFSTKQAGEGTGLGLSVVHGIVSDLGGAIDVTAGAVKGTVVSVWLPVCDTSSSPDVEHVGQEGLPRGNGQVVMVVDDEHALVELAEELLAGLGYEPVGFTSGQSALGAFKAEPTRFDLMLTDETMPGLPGFELAAAVHSIRPDMPIVMMSGHVDLTLQQRAKDAGVQVLLHKPLSLRALAESLISWAPVVTGAK